MNFYDLKAYDQYLSDHIRIHQVDHQEWVWVAKCRVDDSNISTINKRRIVLYDVTPKELRFMLLH